MREMEEQLLANKDLMREYEKSFQEKLNESKLADKVRKIIIIRHTLK